MADVFPVNFRRDFCDSHMQMSLRQSRGELSNDKREQKYGRRGTKVFAREEAAWGQIAFRVAISLRLFLIFLQPKQTLWAGGWAESIVHHLFHQCAAGE